MNLKPTAHFNHWLDDKKTMEVRKLKVNDLVGLAALYKQFWGESSSLEKMRATFQRLNKNPNYIIFVTESERTDALRFYESLGYKSDAYKGFKKRLKKC